MVRDPRTPIDTAAHQEKRPAVFLDRDGTINRDVPYCSRPEDFELLPGAAAGIRLLNHAGLVVVVVTNQSGIARGYFTEAALNEIHKRMHTLLEAHGAKVDAIYYCPHHPDVGCECRKPRTLLARQAANDLGLNLRASYVIGDSAADVEMGRRLGCTTALVQSGLQSTQAYADLVARSLYDAAKLIERRRHIRYAAALDAPGAAT